MAGDKIKIEVLADGTIKVTTDAVSQPNHMNAEAFLREIATLGGGDTHRVKRGQSHNHTHTQEELQQ